MERHYATRRNLFSWWQVQNLSWTVQILLWTAEIFLTTGQDFIMSDWEFLMTGRDFIMNGWDFLDDRSGLSWHDILFWTVQIFRTGQDFIMNGRGFQDDRSRFTWWRVQILILIFLFWHNTHPLAKVPEACLLVQQTIYNKIQTTKKHSKGT